MLSNNSKCENNLSGVCVRVFVCVCVCVLCVCVLCVCVVCVCVCVRPCMLCMCTHTTVVHCSRYEKMISGKYLGEMVRLACHDLIEKKLLFGGKMLPVFEKRECFESAYLSTIEEG